MSIRPEFWIYLIVMAGVTYLVRMLPLVLVKNKIKNRFLLSFLHILLSSLTVSRDCIRLVSRLILGYMPRLFLINHYPSFLLLLYLVIVKLII
mgnify:CR=1 FL=1